MSKDVLQHEEPVLFIVQEYLNKNRFFTFEDIVPYIQIRLKELKIFLNQTGIKEILKSLVEKSLILERSKFTRAEVLENENRKRIFDYICANPGAYFYQIAQKLNLSNYILSWHIRILLNFRYIRSSSIENHEVFFSVTFNDEMDELIALLSKSKSKKILNFLEEHHEGASKTQLSKALCMHSTTVSKYIEKLEQLGVLLALKNPNYISYALNDRLYYQIIKR